MQDPHPEYVKGFNAALDAADSIALDLEQRWRESATRGHEASIIEAAADGIASIRSIIRAGRIQNGHR